MKPPVFDYRDPHELDQVLDLLGEARDDAALLAGGQSLVPLLNMRLARPEMVIDINRVAELDHVAITTDTVTIGSTTRLAALERNVEVTETLPVLTAAASLVAHPQIRNRTTLGGSLCHADPAAELPSVAVALDAVLHVRSRAGNRRVAAAEFFESVFMTSKNPDELLVSAEFPRHPGLTMHYDEISRRQGDFPFVGLCLGLRQDDGVVTEARAAAAGVADRPLRLAGLERALVGRPLAHSVEDAAEAASAEVDPPADHHGSAAFRRGLLRTLVRRLTNRFEEDS